MQIPHNFTSFSPNFFLQFFSWNQSCQQLRSPKPQQFHEFFHPKKSTIFSRNQSWIFGQKMKISNSVLYKGEKAWFEKNPQLHTIALKQNVCASKYASRKKPLITIRPPSCITKARLVICLGNQSLFSFKSWIIEVQNFCGFFRYIYTKVS